MGIWNVPVGRMKAGREHRVPLSAPALAIITALRETRISDFVSPGQKPERPLSGMAFEMLMRRMQAGAFTVHGFRLAFRDWAGDETIFPREVAEQALAHRVGDETERAYRRADALERRRQLMEAWASFCTGATRGNVIRLAKESLGRATEMASWGTGCTIGESTEGTSGVVISATGAAPGQRARLVVRRGPFPALREIAPNTRGRP